MQICTNCHANQLDGTIFCSECGAGMFPIGRPETTRSLGQPTQLDDPFASAPVMIVPPEARYGGPSLTLVIMNSGRRITLDVSDDLLIGRKDSAKGIMPDADLGPDGGYDAGVSRRHAILSYRDGIYLVEDLDSANGTFVNGRRLQPQAATRITNGDELKCGTLLIRVEI